MIRFRVRTKPPEKQIEHSGTISNMEASEDVLKRLREQLEEDNFEVLELFEEKVQ